MALKRISPIQQAIATLDDTIRSLKLQRADLVALLPVTRTRRPDQMVLTLANGTKVFNKKRRIVNGN